MTTRRFGLISGGILAGALLLSTAGLAAAQDPTATPGASPSRDSMAGMMGSQGMGGMMGSQGMGGMMGAGAMTAGQLDEMAEHHDQMVEGGPMDAAEMQKLHAQHHAIQ